VAVVSCCWCRSAVARRSASWPSRLILRCPDRKRRLKRTGRFRNGTLIGTEAAASMRIEFRGKSWFRRRGCRPRPFRRRQPLYPLSQEIRSGPFACLVTFEMWLGFASPPRSTPLPLGATQVVRPHRDTCDLRSSPGCWRAYQQPRPEWPAIAPSRVRLPTAHHGTVGWLPRR